MSASLVGAGKIRVPQRRIWLRCAAALLLITAAVLAWEHFPLHSSVKDFARWAEMQGASGAAVFLAMYVAGAILMLPEGLLTIAAGLAYGFWGGLLVFFAALIGAAAAFLIARHFARDRVQRWIRKRRHLSAVHQAVGDEGWRVVLLCRLSPLLPFVFQNYLFGITEIGFFAYFAATAIGIIPGLALYIYLGALGRAALDGDTGGTLHWIFFSIGLAATALVAWLLARKASSRLRETEGVVWVAADENES